MSCKTSTPPNPESDRPLYWPLNPRPLMPFEVAVAQQAGIPVDTDQCDDLTFRPLTLDSNCSPEN